MDTVKKTVIEPPKATAPPVKAQPQAEHKAQPKAAGSCCGTPTKH